MNKPYQPLSIEQRPYVTPKAEDPYDVPGLNHPFNRACRMEIGRMSASVGSDSTQQLEIEPLATKACA